MKDIVTFDLAKKLKEKGFREKCLYRYADYSKTLQSNQAEINFARKVDCLEFYRCYNVYEDNDIDAPTISQALKWLRELFEIDILPTVKISWIGNLNRIRLYSCNIYSPKLNKPIETECFDSYEEAAIAGINYYLDNLM